LGDGIIYAMDRKSKILLWATIFIVLISLSSTFYKVVVLQDFNVFESEETLDEENLQLDSAEFPNEDIDSENELNFVESQTYSE
jgi:hypothetical protein